MDLIHNSIHGFYKYYCDIKNFDNLSLGSKYSFLAKLFNYLAKFSALKTQKENKKWKMNVYNTAWELCNDLPETYFDEYYDLPDAVNRPRLWSC